MTPSALPKGVELHRTVLLTDLKALVRATHEDDERAPLTTTTILTKRADERRAESMRCFRCGEYGHLRAMCLYHKTRLCYHYQQTGTVCPKGHACQYAHGEAELRTPCAPRCVRIVPGSSSCVVDLGCGATTHTYNACPHRRVLSHGGRRG